MFSSCTEHLTYAVDSGVIQVESEGTFTAEGAVGVDADAVLADAGVIQTLIHIYGESKHVYISTYIYI